MELPEPELGLMKNWILYSVTRGLRHTAERLKFLTDKPVYVSGFLGAR
jgi:hypothetical protein